MTFGKHCQIHPLHGATRLALASWLRLGTACLLGTALLHVIEYHLGLGTHGGIADRLAAVAYMLQHCPLRGELLVVFGLSALILGSVLTVLRAQLQTLRILDLQLAGEVPGKAPLCEEQITIPCHPLRILFLWLLLGAGQTLLFLLALHLMPMTYPMVMHGVHMQMAMTPPVPVVPLSFALATIGAFLLARFERQLAAVIAAIIARLQALFAPVISSRRPRPLLICRALQQLFGPALFSRPPPLFSSC
jgi:hypothetical protein